MKPLQPVGEKRPRQALIAAEEQRFVPGKARGVDATMQFVVTDEGTEHQPFMSGKLKVPG